MKRNEYGALIELDSETGKAWARVVSELELQETVPYRGLTDQEPYKFCPECNDRGRYGYRTQKYHLYDFDNLDMNKVLVMDHYWDGTEYNVKKHVHLKNYYTFERSDCGWVCLSWKGAIASSITRMSKADPELGSLLHLAEFKTVKKVLLTISTHTSNSSQFLGYLKTGS